MNSAGQALAFHCSHFAVNYKNLPTCSMVMASTIASVANYGFKDEVFRGLLVSGRLEECVLGSQLLLCTTGNLILEYSPQASLGPSRKAAACPRCEGSAPRHAQTTSVRPLELRKDVSFPFQHSFEVYAARQDLLSCRSTASATYRLDAGRGPGDIR